MHRKKSVAADWRSKIALPVSLALAMAPAIARAQPEPHDNCDEFGWAQVFGPLGLNHDCEYTLGAGPLGLPAAGVTQDLGPGCPEAPPRRPHRLKFRFKIEPGQLTPGAGTGFGIFELSDDDDPQGPVVIARLDLVEAGGGETKLDLVLDWQDLLGFGQDLPVATVGPGSVIGVEWARSRDANGDGVIDPNGAVRVFLDGLLIAEVTGLLFERRQPAAQRLPTSVTFGVLDPADGIGGTYRFKLLDFLWQYFPDTGPVSP